MLAVGESSRPRLDSLTSLRFFAAIAVVLFHTSAMFNLPRTVEAVTQFGYSGVGFFFVLSGFVLTWSRRAGDTTRHFFGRRFARVWPAHAVMTVVAIPVLLYEGREVPWIAMTSALFLVHGWGPWHFVFNSVSWSLSDEAFFYALFPVVLGLALARRSALLWRSIFGVFAAMVAVGAGVALLLPKGTWIYLLYINPAYRVGEFLIGVALALLMERGWRSPVPLYLAFALAAATGVVLVLLGVRNPAYFVGDLTLLPAFVLIIAAGAGADMDRGPGGLLSRRSMITLGEWSFSLYLVHALVLRTVHAGLADVHLNAWGWLAVSFGAVAAAVFCSWLLYTLVEHPAEKRIRRRLSPSLARDAP